MANRYLQRCSTLVNDWRNENQSQNEVSPHTFQNAYYQKEHIENVSEDVNKREVVHTFDETVNWYSY